MEETTIFKELLINEQIRANEVRLIAENGDQLGVVSFADALSQATSKDLDLVMIATNPVAPVCKIMNYGKFRYEQQKKDKEARKNQKVIEIKEVQLSMVIQENDIQIKAKRAKQHLEEGNKIKVVLSMRGRENAQPARAIEIVNKFVALLEDFGVCEAAPKHNGRNVIVILSPKNK